MKTGNRSIEIIELEGAITNYKNQYTQEISYFHCPYCPSVSRIGRMEVKSIGGRTILTCPDCGEKYYCPKMI